MLRLRVTFCGFDYGAVYGSKIYHMPVDLNVLLHTLDGIRVPTSDTSVQCGAFGYAWFIAGYAATMSLSVGVDPNDINSYQVYLNTSNCPGQIMVEASTTATWVPGVTKATSPPNATVPIQCIPVQTHMSTASTFRRIPTAMPFTVVP
jgi:hypothetical protein